MRLAIVGDTHYGFSARTRELHAQFWARLAAASPEAMVHAGDWASAGVEDLEASVIQCREAVHCPVLTVLGNHDYWDGRRAGWPEMVRRRREAFERHGIRYLGEGPVEIAGWRFTGFDGWYASANPPTNDGTYLPRDIEGVPAGVWLQHRARTGADAVLASGSGPPRRSACVTHFPCWAGPDMDPAMNADPRLLEPLSSRFALLIAGHTHRPCDLRAGSCRVVNPGGDYDAPRFVMLELG